MTQAMTKTNALAALADRCQSATGPDREIDYAIFTALAPVDRGSHWHPTQGNRFTESTDAAIRVVPEGWRVLHIGEQDIDGEKPWVARLTQRNAAFGRAKTVDVVAATPALAITAASLRAAIADMEADHGR